MNVQAQRKQRRWSQPQMARELTAQGVRGLHASSIAKIEAGDRSVRINEAVAYADVFGVPLNTLLGRASEASEDNLTLSVRNIAGVRLLASNRVSARDVMNTRRVVLTRAAIEKLQEVLG